MQEFDWQLQLASHIQEAIQAVAPTDHSKGPCSILEAAVGPLAEQQEQQATRTALAAGLCQVMGFQAVLLRDAPRYATCC